MNIPIVTLDKIFIKPDEKNIYFLDCTRVNGTDEIISRKKESLEEQVLRLSYILRNKDIILADDVIFSGNVLKRIIELFKNNQINVVKVISSISMEKAYRYFNNTLKYGIESNYILSDDVIDQICERDFYFGIAGSGVIIKKDKKLYKSPYFKPFGDPINRASIPKEYEKSFSINCIDRSIYLWKSLEMVKDNKIYMNELPEKIIYTKDEDEVIKVLKKGRMKQIQIGIMGSAEDLNYNTDALMFAKELGKEIAKSNNILIYGAEKEYSSLSTEAAFSASKNGGITVGITGGKDKKIYGDYKPTILINSGLEIGGGREFNLVLSCDVIIAISGGSGTLTEMAIAYQANIPIITVDIFEGWASILSNTYIDKRNRLKCISAKTPKEAVELAIKEYKKINNI